MVKKYGFFIGMAVYALVFLLALGLGLNRFWDYMEAYEQSRPTTAIQNYVSELTVEDMCSGSESLLQNVDPNLQSREQCLRIIERSLTENITFAKNSKESTELRQIYMLSSGEQVIGQFVLTPGDADEFGFRRWQVSEESFDFSHLMGQPITVTVPEDFGVTINGNVLDSSYITERGIPYPALEDFSGRCTMPTMVTYQVDDFLGNVALEVLNREAAFVKITPETDMDSFLPDCTEAEKAELDDFLWEFLTRYVAFTGSSNRAAGEDYLRLIPYMVSQGELAKRLYTAIDGLQFAQSRGDTVDAVTVLRYVPLGEERYLCELRCDVTTLGRKGAVQTTTNMKLLILRTDSGLKAEAMEMY